MNKRPLRQLIEKIDEQQRKHPIFTGIAYLLTALLLIVLLVVTGIIPGLYPQQSHTAAQSNTLHSQTSSPQPHQKYNEAMTGAQPWQNASLNKAKEDLKNMTDLLATNVGVNNATLSDYVSPQSQLGTSDYTAAENALTDLIKQVTGQPATTYDAVSKQCDELDAAYNTWQVAAWKAANETLNGQVLDMNTVASVAKTFLRAHPDYPQPCAVYARDDIARSKGMTREDFYATVGRISESNTWLDQCSNAMSPEQSSAMPQDQITPGSAKDNS